MGHESPAQQKFENIGAKLVVKYILKAKIKKNAQPKVENKSCSEETPDLTSQNIMCIPKFRCSDLYSTEENNNVKIKTRVKERHKGT